MLLTPRAAFVAPLDIAVVCGPWDRGVARAQALVVGIVAVGRKREGPAAAVEGEDVAMHWEGSEEGVGE